MELNLWNAGEGRWGQNNRKKELETQPDIYILDLKPSEKILPLKEVHLEKSFTGPCDKFKPQLVILLELKIG